MKSRERPRPRLYSDAECATADGIVLTPEGRLRAARVANANSGGEVWIEKKKELGKKRKKLYYGLEGFDEHTLEEANRVVDSEWEEFVEEQRSAVGTLVEHLRAKF